MAALLTIGLIFAWFSSQGHMTAGHLQASHAAVSFINNGGDLSKTLNDLGSSQSMRQLATAVVTAGVLSGIGQVTFGEGKNAFRLNDVKVSDGLVPNIGKNLADGVARATINSAITGTDLQTNIRTNVVAGILGAAEQQGANWIGNQTLLGGDFNTNGNVNEFAHEFAHAIVGCAAGVAGASASGSGASTGQGCSAGALGAVVGEMSAQFYGGTDPNQTIAFAQMMGGIAAAAAGLGAEGVSIAANTGANAAQNNYMAHYDTYADNLKACQKDPSGANCSAILSMTEGTKSHYIGQTPSGYRVAANMGDHGAAASYMVASPSGEVMVMEPREWGVFTQMSPEMQSALFDQSQWSLDFSSYVDYSMVGDNEKALSNYGHMFTTGSYWEDMGLNLGLGLVGSRAFTAKILGKKVVPDTTAQYVFDARVGRYREVSTGQFAAARNLPWPDNAGFASSARQTVQPGAILDRYGSETGRFLGEPGATISQRGMAQGTEAMPYTQYRVLKPLEAQVGPAASVPAFGASGGATQYLPGRTIEQLIQYGFLERVVK